MLKEQNNFNTETYLTNPNLLFDGDSSIYYKGIRDFSKKEKKSEGSFTGRHVKISDGILAQRFRFLQRLNGNMQLKQLLKTENIILLEDEKNILGMEIQLVK